MKKYILKDIKKQLNKTWSPVDVVSFNNQVLRVAIFDGEYHWHSHQNEDEFFLIFSGSITIETENGQIILNKGEGTVIPKGLKHKPSANKPSLVLMVEPTSLKSKGD